ncbi:MAG: hypothetical protein ACO37W_06095, partial [Prochlorotrichaceae cyanobacterium]
MAIPLVVNELVSSASIEIPRSSCIEAVSTVPSVLRVTSPLSVAIVPSLNLSSVPALRVKELP